MGLFSIVVLFSILIFTFHVLQWFLMNHFDCFRWFGGCHHAANIRFQTFPQGKRFLIKCLPKTKPAVLNYCRPLLIWAHFLRFVLSASTLSESSTVYVDSDQCSPSNNLSQRDLMSSRLAGGLLWWTCQMKGHYEVWGVLIKPSANSKYLHSGAAHEMKVIMMWLN